MWGKAGHESTQLHCAVRQPWAWATVQPSLSSLQAEHSESTVGKKPPAWTPTAWLSISRGQISQKIKSYRIICKGFCSVRIHCLWNSQEHSKARDWLLGWVFPQPHWASTWSISPGEVLAKLVLSCGLLMFLLGKTAVFNKKVARVCQEKRMYVWPAVIICHYP